MRRSMALPYLLISPAVILILVFVFYPTLYGFQLSFMRMIPLTGGFEYTGLDNYRNMLSDANFWGSALVTARYAVAYVVLVLILGFVFALFMNRGPRLIDLYMTLIFIPWVLSDVVAGIVWRMLWNQSIGFLEVYGRLLPFWPKQGMMATPEGAQFIMVLLALWRGLPFTMLLLLAGLQTIARELSEAARIDGASAWRSFWSITFPLMRPQFLVLLLLLSIGSVNAAGIFLAVTDGGPARATEVLALYMYRVGFLFFRIDHGSALAMMMFVVNLALALVYLRLFRSEYRI